MNDLFASLGLLGAKAVLAALVLPPAPWLLLVLVGAAWRLRRPRLGATTVVLAVAGLWVCSTMGGALALADALGLSPAALTPQRLAALRAQVAEAPRGQPPRVAIVALGGGLERRAPEYDAPSLTTDSLERLRYAVWLSRATGAPVAFSGGLGWAQLGGHTEAAVAARIAAEEFGHPLRWTEQASRDTRGNAAATVPLLRAAGVERIVLVTHGWHMARALRAFEGEAGQGLAVEAAPVGLDRDSDLPLLRWLPSGAGALRMRQVLREWVGLRMGA